MHVRFCPTTRVNSRSKHDVVIRPVRSSPLGCQQYCFFTYQDETPTVVAGTHRIEDLAYFFEKVEIHYVFLRVGGEWVKVACADSLADLYLRHHTCLKMARMGIPFPLAKAPNNWVQCWQVLLNDVTNARFWATVRTLCKLRLSEWLLPNIKDFVGVGTLEWQGSPTVPTFRQQVPRSRFHKEGYHAGFFSYLMQFLTLQHDPESIRILHVPAHPKKWFTMLVSAVAAELGCPNTLRVANVSTKIRRAPYQLGTTRVTFADKGPGCRRGSRRRNPALIAVMKRFGFSRHVADLFVRNEAIEGRYYQQWWLDNRFGTVMPRKRRGGDFTDHEYV